MANMIGVVAISPAVECDGGAVRRIGGDERTSDEDQGLQNKAENESNKKCP